MTGRHRGQPKDREPGEAAETRAPRRRRVAMVAGAFLVPVALATVVALSLREEPSGRADGAPTPTPRAAQAAPSAEPTIGKYVPPESEPQAETKAPRRVATTQAEPTKKGTPKPSQPPDVRPSCPWAGVPYLDQWCHRHRHPGR
ncbi:hypothetical protein [Actinomadura nitritigenes]|uniref:Uncharacterized protein n=1 Tax=Actinomadura nitritigenes TaxID=134602 RepID=A0ABS3R9E9_9ACTN|nr:hypothetical protein [Actinomadura nitritigenes]MBO2442857.1 hypothetical protein [Actinomadura nitritigenes]